MFIAIVLAFIFGLLIGVSSRVGKKSSQTNQSESEKTQMQSDFDLNYREFIGFPVSPAMRRFNQESEISTILVTESMRNNNMHRALQIKRDRQNLIKEYDDSF